MIETVIAGNILETRLPIVQQCSCLATRKCGLAKSISNRFPKHGDFYTRRKKNGKIVPDRPGTILVSKDPAGVEPAVIALFAQWTPGKAGRKNNYAKSYVNEDNEVVEVDDTEEGRVNMFKSCISELDKLKLKHVAMPYGIGCGLAGGDWNVYEKIIADSSTPVVLYKLNR